MTLALKIFVLPTDHAVTIKAIMRSPYSRYIFLERHVEEYLQQLYMFINTIISNSNINL